MSDTDRPQAPHFQPRGAWPDQPDTTRSRGRRDLARSSADGWPSVEEWREQRLRLRDSPPP
ncbi:hypothetical protein, partial [Nonomuraea cypriaca]|uniref:hypothetical protein n=1 Tax=Nonomuraea cypriaca TaxID=1187855 RepID=UPI001A9C8B0D